MGLTPIITPPPFQSVILNIQGKFEKVWSQWCTQVFRFMQMGALKPQIVLQAKLADLSTTLTKSDLGILAYISDFNHVLQWTSTAWMWGPGETGSGYYALFSVAPTGAGWHICDGTLGVKYLKSDGTLGLIDLPLVDPRLDLPGPANTYFRT